MSGVDYKAAGVDREQGEVWLEEMSSELSQNLRPEIRSSVGGYGAEYVTPKHIKDPVWVASTDGVGTKLVLAEDRCHETGKPDSFFGIGIDLVAMSTNDILACRAEPLIFLDYLATGKIEKTRQQVFLRGVLEGCKQAGCSLVGGETAEMPGFYSAGRMDVAGFCVGVRDAAQKVNPVEEGDEVWGLSSDGFHSNGYSLVRKIISDRKMSGTEVLGGEKLLDYLLKPTRIYSKEILPLLKDPNFKACAHITGGGVLENLPRVFSSDWMAKIQKSQFATSSWMKQLAEWSGMPEKEAFSTWNMGIGLCAVVHPSLGSRLKSEGWVNLGKMERRDSSLESVILV